MNGLNKSERDGLAVEKQQAANKQAASLPPQVVFTAGFDRAWHVYGLAEWLRRDGVEIAGVIVVSPYTLRRLRRRWRKQGLQGLWNAVPRLLGRGPGGGSKGGRAGESAGPLQRLLDRLAITPGSLRSWTKRHDVPYHSVTSVNDEVAVRAIKQARPDWVVYGGGGILHTPFIEAAGGRILNAHHGPLPEVRGMNACEWALLLGHAPAVTIHLIDRGIDTGTTLTEYPVRVASDDDIETLRSRCLARGMKGLRDAILNPPDTLPAPQQAPDRHRQCFTMAPALREILADRLGRGIVPLRDGETICQEGQEGSNR
jgi:hypothetical protein